MKGLELSKRFYLECGEPMLKENFSHLLPYIAVGLAGSGSECLGYDDELSRDHDFEAGFCIFLPGEDIVDRRAEFLLERAYSKLPSEFMGYKRAKLSPVGGNRHGVIRMSEFFKDKTSSENGELSLRDWFCVPEQSLLEATCGEVFYDGLGLFSEIRKKLSYFPSDVRIKKLAGNLLLMGQAGQYNYSRSVMRFESGAAQLAMFEFVKAAMNAIFLINERYAPYYKWSFYALRRLDTLSFLADSLEYLISSPNGADESRKKSEVIEHICAEIAAELKNRGLSDATGAELERHAYSVNNKISDPNLRNAHILFGV